MALLSAPPNRQPIMATNMLGAYRAYAQRPPAAAYAPPSRPRSLPVQASAERSPREEVLNTSHGVLAALQHMIGTLHQRGEGDTAEFKQLYDHYKRLSALLKRGALVTSR